MHSIYICICINKRMLRNSISKRALIGTGYGNKSNNLWLDLVNILGLNQDLWEHASWWSLALRERFDVHGSALQMILKDCFWLKKKTEHAPWSSFPLHERFDVRSFALQHNSQRNFLIKKNQNMHRDAASPSTRDLMYMRPSSFCWNTVLQSQRPSIMTINHYYNND